MRRVLLLLLLLAVPLAAQEVTVVNMIPSSLSNETERDAEPSVSVDPVNPRRIAATAFTPDPLRSGVAPMFVSTDGGTSWELRPLVPGGDVTFDNTLSFGGLSGTLYAAGITDRLQLLRKPDFSAALPTVLRSRDGDQPWISATTLLAGAAPDRVYTGINIGRGEVEQSLDAATAPPPAGLSTVPLRAGGCNTAPRSAPPCTPRDGSTSPTSASPTVPGRASRSAKWWSCATTTGACRRRRTGR